MQKEEGQQSDVLEFILNQAIRLYNDRGLNGFGHEYHTQFEFSRKLAHDIRACYPAIAPADAFFAPIPVYQVIAPFFYAFAAENRFLSIGPNERKKLRADIQQNDGWYYADIELRLRQRETPHQRAA